MESVPRKFSIVQANRYMIDHVNYLIAYAWHPASNAQNLVEYAERRNMLITNIACQIISFRDSFQLNAS